MLAIYYFYILYKKSKENNIVDILSCYLDYIKEKKLVQSAVLKEIEKEILEYNYS